MLSFALSLLIALSAFAKNDCVKAVVSPNPTQFDEEPDSSSLDQAEQWLLRLGDMDATLEKGLQAYRNWQRWNSVTSEQRSHMLALELKLISPDLSKPDQFGQLVKLDGRTKLKELSARNLKRMIYQMRIQHPFADELSQNSKFSKQAENISKTFRIAYAAPLLVQVSSSNLAASGPSLASAPPIASPREMLRSGIYSQTSDYYSHMLSGAPSAPINIRLVSPNERAPAGLYLKPDMAMQEGFMMPEFQSPEDLIAFFAVWHIEALDELRKDNHMSFPSSVNSGRKMIDYFRKSGVPVDSVFPPDKPEKMRTLRQKLSDYVLTEEDGRAFLREGFRLYTLHLAETKQAQYTALTGQLFSKFSVEVVRGFFDFIQFPAMTLRVPVAVTSSDYTIIRELPPRQAHYAPTFGGAGFATFEQRQAHDASKPPLN